MSKIPTQLQENGFRFIKLGWKLDNKGFRGKIPLEGDWQNTKNYDYNDPEIQQWMQVGNNVGVCTGYNMLLVPDIDSQEEYERVKNLLPPTFTIKSGGRGLPHYYYKVKDVERVPNKKSGKVDLRGQGGQVVCTGSFLKNEVNAIVGTYEIMHDLPIAEISWNEIKKIFSISEIIESEGADYSNSATEYKEILSLVKKGNNDDRIDSYMVSRGFAKWIGASLQYKALTIQKARDAVANSRLITSDDLGIFTNYNDMANKFITIHPIYFDSSKLWWLWDEERKAWELTDEIELMILIDEHLRNTNTLHAGTKNMILESLKRASRKNKPEKIPTHWIQFENGIIDVRTQAMIEPSSQYFTLNPIPWSVSESDATPNMDRIFKEWVGEKHVQTLYEIISYCLLSDYPLNRIFCFVGGGLNGKSKCLELINRFIGERNITSTELDTLLTSRFEITKLHKKLVCQMGETDFSTLYKTSILKKLSGGDLIGFEYKGKNPFEDKNYAKILIATNNLPLTDDKTMGFYRRWLIIDFPNQFTEKKDVLLEIPDKEYNNLARKSIGILSRLLEQREFSNEGTLDQRKMRYEEKSNSVDAFINQRCIQEPNAEIAFQEFNSNLMQFCKEKRFRELSAKQVGSMLGNLGFQRENKTVSVQNPNNYSERTLTSKRIIIGLRLKTKEDEQNIDNKDNIDALNSFL